MNKIKILVLEKDVLVRQAIAGILNSKCQCKFEADVRVSGNIGESENIIRKMNPDVVFLDIEKSAADGYTVFNTLRVRYPGMPIVVISSRSENGARAVLYALRKGAVDFITKLEQNNALLLNGNHLLKRIPPIIDTVARIVSSSSKTAKRSAGKVGGNQKEVKEATKNMDKVHHGKSLDLITIGGSMGGLDALYSIVKQLPGDFSVPIVVAQHFPQKYTRVLAHDLNKVSNLEVREAGGTDELMPGVIYIAPGGNHTEVQHNGNTTSFKIHRGPRENGVRPSMDVLFRSAAGLYGSGVLSVILSGYGNDGIAGARKIKDAGGQVLVQDPDNAQAAELPLTVLEAGLADNYYSAEQISRHILNRIPDCNKSRFAEQSFKIYSLEENLIDIYSL